MYESVLKLGGVCGFVVGALYLLIGITHFFLPRDQLRGAAGVDERFFRSLAEKSFAFKAHYWTAVGLGLFMLPVIAALVALFRGGVTGGAIWAGAVGFLGAGLLSVDFAYVAVEAPRLARVFARLPEAAREAILALGLPHLDPCFLSWGLIGGAMAYLNLGLFLQGLIPAGLAGLGVLGACSFWEQRWGPSPTPPDGRCGRGFRGIHHRPRLGDLAGARASSGGRITPDEVMRDA